MKKLDEFKIKWIILQKQNGETARIAEIMNTSIHLIKKLWVRYRYTDLGKIVYPTPIEMQENNLPRRREHSAVLAARTEDYLGAIRACMESSGTVPE